MPVLETVENFDATAINKTRESQGMRCLYALFDLLPPASLLSCFFGGASCGNRGKLRRNCHQ